MASLLLEEGRLTLPDVLHANRHVENRLLRRREHSVHPAKHEQRQHDRAVFVLLEGAAQFVGDLPDEGDLVLEPDGGHSFPSLRLRDGVSWAESKR